MDILLKTNPQRIYVENIRSYFNTSTVVASTLCKMAVKDGKFIKKTGVICPNPECERIIKSYEEDIPNERLTCEICELLGIDNYSFNVNSLDKIEFYQLAL